MSLYIQIGAGADNPDAKTNNCSGYSFFVKSLILRPKNRIAVEANKHNLELLNSSWIKFSNLSVYQFAIYPRKNITKNTIELFIR